MLHRWLAVVAAGVLATGAVVAAERKAALKSGPEPGAMVAAYEVVKAAGAEEDGVKVGEKLCYRCMLGNRPVVNVFTRSVDDELAGLLKGLDQSVEKHAEAKLASFVNLLGKDAEKLAEQGRDFVKAHQLKQVAIVVPDALENGPEEYSVSPDADVTVIVYKKGEVVATHAFAEGELSEKAVAAVLADAEKLVN